MGELLGNGCLNGSSVNVGKLDYTLQILPSTATVFTSPLLWFHSPTSVFGEPCFSCSEIRGVGRAHGWGFRNPPAQCALNCRAIINQTNRGLLTVCASQGGGLLGVVKSLALSEKAWIVRHHSLEKLMASSLFRGSSKHIVLSGKRLLGYLILFVFAMAGLHRAIFLFYNP